MLNRFVIFAVSLVGLLSLPAALRAAGGELDTSFNPPDGYVLWDGGSGYDRGRDVALQPDGKIVVTGYRSHAADDDLFVVRYNQDGSIDTDFGTDGLFTFDGGNGDDGGLAIAIQTDGKIVVAGYQANLFDIDVLVLRLTADGGLDDTFGAQGVVVSGSGQGDDQAVDLTVQPDGKIVLAGQTANGTDSEAAVWRLTADGDFDAEFGIDGIATHDVGSGFDGALRAALQPDGKIVVTGFGRNTQNYDIVLLRFDSDGVLDANFGINGFTDYDGGDYDRGYGLAIQTDGKILVTGVRSTVVGNDADYDIPLLRFNVDGSLDTGFGQDGIVLFSNDMREQAFDLAIQDDGKILVVGESGNFVDWALIVLRYNQDGTPDTSFGTNGAYSYNDVGTDWGYGVSIDTRGRIVVAGQSFNGIDDDVIVLRLDNSDNDPDGDGDDDEGGEGCFIGTSR